MTKDVTKEQKTFAQKVVYHITMFFIVTMLYIIPMSIHIYLNGGINQSFQTTYTLTNGDKTVVFQGMTHIGLPSFYQQVGGELTHYRSKGYAIFLEGIGHSDDKKLKKGDPDYDKVVKKYAELVEKDRVVFAETLKKVKYVMQYQAMPFYYSYDDSYIDFTVDELKASIDESLTKKKGSENEKAIIKETYSDALGDHTEAYAKLLKDERYFIISSNLRNFFFFNFVDDYIMPSIRKMMNNPSLDVDVTMNGRNKKISDAINSSTNKNIYILYGSSHFKGVFANLKAADSNWKIVNTTQKTIFKR